MATIAPERAQTGYALHENEGEAFWLLGMLQTIKISRDDTGGAYGLAEIVVPEGIGSPWHVHPEEDEWFYVLEGEITFWVADTRLSLTAGSFGFGPKGVPHTFYAEAGGAKALVGFAPQSILRRDPQNVAVDFLREAVVAQHDVQTLVPRNFIQN